MMFVQRVIFYSLTVFIIFTTTAKSYAQNNSWLKRDWEGRAYTLGNNPQSFSVVLTVLTVKGKNFEGVIKAVETTNPSNHFDSKITGVVNDRYLYVNIDTWKGKCSTCRPKVLEYSMESGRFFLKGEAKGCSTVECTWITEFSEPLITFNNKEQTILFAMADVEPPAPSEDTTTVAKNEQPIADTAAVVKETPPPPPQRIPILAAGSVTLLAKDNSAFASKTPSTLKDNISTTVKENEKRLPILPPGDVVAMNTGATTTYKTPAILSAAEHMSIKENPEQRTPVLKSGDVVAMGNKNDLYVSRKTGAISNAPSMNIRENPEKKFHVLPSGEIVSSNNNTTSLQNPSGALTGSSAIAVKQSEEKKFEVLSSGEVVLTAHTSGIVLKKPSYLLPARNSSLKLKEVVVAAQPTIPKDTGAALPTGYAERKKNVIRTLTVNTDSIMLRVYDNGVVDGDIVSVIYNDKVVIDKLSLTSRAVVVKIPVNKAGINTLVFHAHNLGEFPPNTALLEILYGSKKEELTVSSDLTVSSAIDIEYQQ